MARLLVLVLSIAATHGASYYQMYSYGDGSASTNAALYTAEMTDIAATGSAYAALFANGQVIVRGNSDAGGGTLSSSLSSSLNNGVTTVIGNRMAFCALKDDGSVVTWPDTEPWTGGNSSGVQAQLTNVTAVFKNDWVFVAVNSGKEIIAWGDEYFGASVPDDLDMSVDVNTIVSTRRAFAVLRTDGSVVTWGNSDWGGNSSEVSSSLSSDVESIVAAEGGAFAALKSDGSVVTWGNPDRGGDSSSVQANLTGVTSIAATYGAFAAINSAGSAVAWGDAEIGGDLSSVASVVYRGVASLYATKFAFAVIKNDGSVRTWGDPLYGGDSFLKGLDGDISTIYSNPFAFVAMKSTGDVLPWGSEQYGGSLVELEGDFLALFKVASTFARCKTPILAASNTLQSCARNCASRSNCPYFSFNYDDTLGSDATRCSIYKTSSQCRTYIDATSQTLYQLNTTLTFTERSAMTKNALISRGVSAIYSNDFSFFAVTEDSDIGAWGAANYGGSYTATFPSSATVVSVASSKVGYGMILSYN